MKKTFVNKNFFKDASNLYFDYNFESSLFIKNDELLKIIKHSLIKSKENTINQLELLNHKYCPDITSILYDKTGTIGYSMVYYKTYNTIDNLINNENASYEEKIAIIKKLYEVFQFFDKNKYAFDDIHEKNILYMDTDIKIVDLDSGIFSNNENFDYKISKILQDMGLSKLVLSILYGIPLYSISSYLNQEELLINIPNNLKKLYKYIINGEFKCFDSSDYIDLFSDDFIKETKLILK